MQTMLLETAQEKLTSSCGLEDCSTRTESLPTEYSGSEPEDLHAELARERRRAEEAEAANRQLQSLLQTLEGRLASVEGLISAQQVHELSSRENTQKEAKSIFQLEDSLAEAKCKEEEEEEAAQLAAETPRMVLVLQAELHAQKAQLEETSKGLTKVKKMLAEELSRRKEVQYQLIERTREITELQYVLVGKEQVISDLKTKLSGDRQSSPRRELVTQRQGSQSPWREGSCSASRKSAAFLQMLSVAGPPTSSTPMSPTPQTPSRIYGPSGYNGSTPRISTMSGMSLPQRASPSVSRRGMGVQQLSSDVLLKTSAAPFAPTPRSAAQPPPLSGLARRVISQQAPGL